MNMKAPHNLIRGMVTSEQFDFIVNNFIKFRSDEVIKYLRKYFVDGWSVQNLVNVYDVKENNFNRDRKKFEDAVRNVFAYLELINVRCDFNADK